MLGKVLRGFHRIPTIDVNIQAISPGQVTLPKAHVSAQYPTVLGRYGAILRDRSTSGPFPIWCWVIDHPEGVIVVDVGEVPAVFEPRGVDFGARLLVDRGGLKLTPCDDFAVQLRDCGFTPEDVDTVVLTHLHFDHAGALERFPNAEVLVSRRDWYAHRLLPLGSSIHRWSDSVDPTPITYEDGPFGPFSKSHVVTDAADVIVVPTPGHTPGHQSVIVREDDRLLFLAGDTTFTERQLLENEVPGISLDAKTSRRTMQRIRRLCANEEVIYLPSHDPEGMDRFEGRQLTNA